MEKYLITLLPIASTASCIGLAMNGMTVRAILAAILTVAYGVITYVVWVGEIQAANARKGTH